MLQVVDTRLKETQQVDEVLDFTPILVHGAVGMLEVPLVRFWMGMLVRGVKLSVRI